MKYFADQLGYGAERRFRGNAGLLYDIDFEQFPDRHRIKVTELLEACIASPEHEMEKVLYAADK